MIKGQHIVYRKQREGSALFIVAFIVFLMTGCGKHENKNAMFKVLGDDQTGLHFVNSLKATQEFQVK